MPGVIHIITSLDKGGAQRNTLESVAQLHRADRPQLLFTGQPSPGQTAALDDEAKRRLGERFIRLRHLVHPISPRRDMLALLEMTRVLQRAVHQMRPPVVLHTHSSKAGLLGRLVAGSMRGVHSVFTQHGFAFDGFPAHRQYIAVASEKLAGAATDVMVFVSDDDRQRALRMQLAPRAEHRVIRSGVSPHPFVDIDRSNDARRRARRALGLDENVPLAVTVGNLKLQKDPLLHVRILHAWRQREPNAELLLLGDGPLRGDTEQLARDLGVDDALHLPGFVKDPCLALQAADVFLLASAWEGLPRASLEAICSGIPMVVRECGYAHELDFVDEGLAVLDFDAAPDAYAQKLVARGPAPKRWLPARFTLRGMLDDLDALYDEMLA